MLAYPRAVAEEKVETPAIGYHGTDVNSAVALLNGAPLLLEVAMNLKTDGLPGFYLATDWRDAEYFAARRQPGTICNTLFLAARWRRSTRLVDSSKKYRPAGWLTFMDLRFSSRQLHFRCLIHLENKEKYR